MTDQIIATMNAPDYTDVDGNLGRTGFYQNIHVGSAICFVNFEAQPKLIYCRNRVLQHEKDFEPISLGTKVLLDYQPIEAEEVRKLVAIQRREVEFLESKL